MNHKREDHMNQTAKLGDRVRCSVTGFTGTVVAEHNYLHGCCRLTVLPAVDEKGSLKEEATFDAPQLIVLEESVAEIGDRSVGGPEKFMPGRRPGD